MKKPKDNNGSFKSEKSGSKTINPLKNKPTPDKKEGKPEEFEEERSMDIRMIPQPLQKAKGKTDKK